MEYFRALRLAAMQAVVEPDLDAQLRHIFRWYSKTFATPLDEVYDLPQEDILEAFYEEEYEGLNEDERQKEISELLETPEERLERLIAKDVERYEAYHFAKFSLEEEKKADAAREARRLADLKAVKEGKKSLLQFTKGKEAPETELPRGAPKQEEADIKMKFVSADDFEAELQGLGGLVGPKK
jgi:succinate dehydrogenase flavin-adding protein (antitoxin of CptAB toxin-antitoxin module)